jgi:hypothetical protein
MIFLKFDVSPVHLETIDLNAYQGQADHLMNE